MQLATIAEPRRYRMKMLRKESINTDGRGIESALFQEGEEGQFPLDLGRSLERDGIAVFLDKVPPVEKKVEAFLAEQARKANAFPGFVATKEEIPVLHFTHNFVTDKKLQSNDFVAVFVDFMRWDASPQWHNDNPERFATWKATSQVLLSDYVQNPYNREALSYVLPAVVKALSGEVNQGLRFSVNESHPKRVYVTAGYGGNLGFLFCDAASYTSALQTGYTVSHMESSFASRYQDIWTNELLLWHYNLAQM